MRKEVTIQIEDGERELTFAVRQMPALKLERWINRAVILLARAGGAEIKDMDLTTDGLRNVWRMVGKDDDAGGIAEKVIRTIGGLDYEAAEPLYNELLECCALIPDPAKPGRRMPMTAATIEGNIENPITLYRLRLEAVKVNFSFFQKSESSPNGPEGAGVVIKAPPISGRRPRR